MEVRSSCAIPLLRGCLKWQCTSDDDRTKRNQTTAEYSVVNTLIEGLRVQLSTARSGPVTVKGRLRQNDMGEVSEQTT